jgi:hypothetical protein
MPRLHKAHAAFHEAASDEQLPVLRSLAVGLPDVCRLLIHIEGVGGLHLHAVGQLEGANPRLEGRLARTGGQVIGVQFPQQVKLPLLVLRPEASVADVVDQLPGIGL